MAVSTNFFNLHSPPTQGVPLTNFTTVSPSVPLSSPFLCLLQPSLPVSWEPKGSDLPLNGGLQSPKFSDLTVKLLLVHVANHFSQRNLSFSSWHSVFMNKKTDFAENKVPIGGPFLQRDQGRIPAKPMSTKLRAPLPARRKHAHLRPCPAPALPLAGKSVSH